VLSFGKGSSSKLAIFTLGRLGWVLVLEVENCLATEDHDAHNDNVPKSDTVDLAPDGLLKDLVSIFDGRFIQNRNHWRHSGQGKSSESINDQVDPEKLRWGKGRFSQVEVANENSDKHWEVAGNLEHQEALNVGINVATPHDSIHAIKEIIVSQNDVRILLSDDSAGAHAEADVSCAERFDIVVTIANDCGFFTSSHESSSQEKLVIRSGTSQNF